MTNPLTSKPGRDKLTRYYLGAAKVWHEAASLQAKRCDSKHEGERDYMIDICFFAVAVWRLRETAVQVEKRLGLSAIETGRQAFDEEFPKLGFLRNLLEHVLPPKSDPRKGELGVTFFPGAIADLKAGGRVEYLVEVRDMEPALTKLYTQLVSALSPG